MKPDPFYVIVDRDGTVTTTFPQNSVFDEMCRYAQRILPKLHPADAPFSLWLITDEGWFEQKEKCNLSSFFGVEMDHKMRCRVATQKIIETIGSCGKPESLEEATERIIAHIEALRKENKMLMNKNKE